MTATLIVMFKQAVMGRVNTRLAHDIGPTRATQFHRHMVNKTLTTLSRDRRWKTLAAITPDRANIQAPCPIIGQGRGDLGARMEHLLARNTGPTIVVGTDIIGLNTDIIGQAFKALGNHDLVFGPATDGGFYLVGCKHRPPKNLFAGVPWSQANTLARTLSGLVDYKVAQLAECSDVDNGAAYEAAPLQTLCSFRRGISSTKLHGR